MNGEIPYDAVGGCAMTQTGFRYTGALTKSLCMVKIFYVFYFMSMHIVSEK